MKLIYKDIKNSICSDDQNVPAALIFHQSGFLLAQGLFRTK